MNLIDAIALLNTKFESRDGRPVDQAVITRADYRALVQVMSEADTDLENLRHGLVDDDR